MIKVENKKMEQVTMKNNPIAIPVKNKQHNILIYSIIIIFVMVCSFTIALIYGTLSKSKENNYKTKAYEAFLSNSINVSNFNSIKKEFIPALVEACNYYNVDINLMFVLVYNQSAFNPYLDRNGTIGLFQISSEVWVSNLILETFGKVTNKEQLKDIKLNTFAGVKIFSIYKDGRTDKDALYLFFGKNPARFENETEEFKTRRLNYMYKILGDYSHLIRIKGDLNE